MSLGTGKFPRPSPIADDGDALRFCSTCAFSDACLSQGFDKAALGDLHVLVEHVGPFHEGEHVFREGEEFTAIAAVRAGTVKTYVVDPGGHEQVLGFFLPGEVIGLNAIHQSRYPCNAVALDTVMLCRFSFPKMALLATRLPGLQAHLFRLLSQDIGKAALLAGDYSADQRMAAFLVTLSRRYAQRGFSATRFHLTMSRTDIANYLRLAPETVSRVLRRFQDENLVLVERRELESGIRRACTNSRAWCCATERRRGLRLQQVQPLQPPQHTEGSKVTFCGATAQPASASSTISSGARSNVFTRKVPVPGSRSAVAEGSWSASSVARRAASATAPARSMRNSMDLPPEGMRPLWAHRHDPALTWIRAAHRGAADHGAQSIQPGRRAMDQTRKLWTGLIALLLASFAVLLWMGGEIHRQSPPMPNAWSPKTARCCTRAPTSRPAARSGRAPAASSSARSGATARWSRPTGARTGCTARPRPGWACAHRMRTAAALPR
jgi:CRP/FNR family transcriptional regulator